tara:strand:- start:1860 stop:2609 length:750 start_codon:yes stop_codon:yes gene_type:complete
MLLDVITTNVSEWKSIVNAIGNISEEAMFICNSDGITFRGIDPTHVSLLDVTFPKESFEKFECETTFFGLRIADFKNVLNAADNNDVIQFQIEQQDNLKILISGSIEMTYSLRLIEKTEVNTPLPKIDRKSKISISPNALTRIISNIEKISENMTITTLEDKVEFYGIGDIGDAKIDLKKSDESLHELDIIEDTTAVYSLEYMADVIRSIGRSCKNINMEFSSKSPINIGFEMPSKTMVGFYLAPRVQD